MTELDEIFNPIEKDFPEYAYIARARVEALINKQLRLQLEQIKEHRFTVMDSNRAQEEDWFEAVPIEFINKLEEGLR